MRAVGFDWDAGNTGKCRKHGVRLGDIEHIFAHGPRVTPDSVHSIIEDRFIAVGRTLEDRMLFVVFTLRRRHGTVLIRPISARYMHRQEAERYEEDGA